LVELLDEVFHLIFVNFFEEVSTMISSNPPFFS
jgi:hypothetical protein